VIDNRDLNCSLRGGWQRPASDAWGNPHKNDYLYATVTPGSPTREAVYHPFIRSSDKYTVEIWYPSGSNRSTNSPWTISFDGGSTNVSVNQQIYGAQWVRIASGLPFAQGTNGQVRLSNSGEDEPSVIIGDAVRFVPSKSDFKDLFNGRGLSGWKGDSNYWSVREFPNRDDFEKMRSRLLLRTAAVLRGGPTAAASHGVRRWIDRSVRPSDVLRLMPPTLTQPLSANPTV